MKLSKQKSKLHAQACEILKQDILSESDKEFVLDHWHEGAVNDISRAGAFFTPQDLAWDFAFELGLNTHREGIKYRVIDLCAGIGMLAYAMNGRYGKSVELVCLEANPEYVEVGKKLLPEATWICGSVGDVELIKSLGAFDICISNPPFGNVATMKDVSSPSYKGAEAHYKVCEIGSLIANYCAFILPQQACPFKLSGQRCYTTVENDSYESFSEQTGVVLEAGCGIDTTCYSQFKATKIVVEFAFAETNECEWESEPLKEEEQLAFIM